MAEAGLIWRRRNKELSGESQKLTGDMKFLQAEEQHLLAVKQNLARQNDFRLRQQDRLLTSVARAKGFEQSLDLNPAEQKVPAALSAASSVPKRKEASASPVPEAALKPMRDLDAYL